MKKSLLILASLAIGTAAFAQQSPAPGSSAPPLAADAPAAPVTDPPPAPGGDSASAAPADTANYPPCSRSVHDKCTQSQAGHRHMAHHKRR